MAPQSEAAYLMRGDIWRHNTPYGGRFALIFAAFHYGHLAWCGARSPAAEERIDEEFI
ncbi:MAG: hypothetical protein IJ935_06960 [Afipia sp.]|nr:hypothetical protein [Afipia sp.]